MPPTSPPGGTPFALPAPKTQRRPARSRRVGVCSGAGGWGEPPAVGASRKKLFEQFNEREIKRFDGRTQKLALADARVEPWEMTQRQRLLTRLIDPNIAFL